MKQGLTVSDCIREMKRKISLHIIDLERAYLQNQLETLIQKLSLCNAILRQNSILITLIKLLFIS